LRYVQRTSRKLARCVFHAMVRYGPKLERRQLILGRLVDIGTELFAVTAVCARAQALQTGSSRDEKSELLKLADYFCRTSRLRIREFFGALGKNADARGYE